MRPYTLLLIFLFIVLVKGRTIELSSTEQDKDNVLAKKDENVDSNLQDDPMESEMNEGSNEGEQGVMDDGDDEITKAEENLGMHYFQGDVLTTNGQMAKLNHMLDSDSSSNNQLHSRALVKDVRRTWEKAVVPYVIKEDASKHRKDIVKAAIKHWQEKTCLKFKERKDEKDYVVFQEGNGCSSFVGRIGGKQTVSVGNDKHRCRVGNIIHEIGHTIGFFHEQSRPDRDEFVKINWKNVNPAYKVNFLKFSQRVIDSKDVSYDYGSIMHYPRKIFGKKKGAPTVIPNKDPDAQIGQRLSLSDLDILQVGKMYDCRAKSKKDKDKDGMENTDSDTDSSTDSTTDSDTDSDTMNNTDNNTENELGTIP